MTLPEWVESVTGLVGKLTATPLKISDRAFTAASYLGASFGAAVASLVSEGLARPLKELSDSKLQKIKSIDVADAATAHNKEQQERAKVGNIEADTEVKLSYARINDANAEKISAEARDIDGQTEYNPIKEEEERLPTEARLAQAVRKLEAKGGGLYLDPPSEDDQ